MLLASIRIDEAGERTRSRAAGSRLPPFIAGLCLLLAAPPFAAALDPSRAITQYGHAIFTVEDGLPQNSIQAVLQTRDGFLWLCTEEGLVRFDGVRFTVFNLASEAAFKDHDVRALCEDKEGALWIGTQGGGLIRFKGGVFTLFDSASGLPSNRVTSLFMDKLGKALGGHGPGSVPPRQRHLRFAPRPGHLPRGARHGGDPRAPSGSPPTAKGFSASPTE